MNNNKNKALINSIGGVIRKNPGLSIILVSVVLFDVLLALLPPLVLERIVNNLISGAGVTLAIALSYFLFLALSGVFDSAQTVMITRFGQKITHELRSKLCAKLKRLPADYFTANEAGKIVSLFVNDVDAMGNLFDEGIISMFADVCKIIGILIVIFTRSTGLGIILLIVTPLLLWLTRVFQKKMLSAQLSNREAIARMNNHVPETLRNLRMIQSFAKQHYMEQRYDSYIQDSYESIERANLYDSIYSPIIIFTSSAVIAVMLILSALSGGMQQFFGMSVGSAVAVIAYVGKIFTPLESIGMEIENIQSAVAGVRRTEAFLQEQERQMPKQHIPKSENNHTAAAISVENVTFGYEPKEPVLQNLSINIPLGDNVTLAGRTGAGKSTIFKLLLGLYVPQQGQVKIFGADASNIIDGEKRHLFGYVEQSIKLVQGTVGEQISLFDNQIGPKQISAAAKLVGLDEMIEKLPQGYDTTCEARLFSQGQLQLLSIARAIAANPMILLLDEITANLDSGTEKMVMKALEEASAHRTVISISHRLYEQAAGSRLVEIH